ncbi:MAG: ion transporter [Lachnospiraceae bacterium]|nr:ion transporter [Lachnospiraceae bacterium]
MEKVKKRVFDVIQIGNKQDLLSATFDWFIVFVIFLNLFVTLFDTFDESIPYKELLKTIELITIIIFAVEYSLRLWTAEYAFPEEKKWRAKLGFMISFYGIIDLVTFLPYFLPVFFPKGAVAFRIFRVIRIFRLFKINARYDAFNAIVNVLNEKKNQIFSSVCMILILMVASSLCMYGLEHEAQPDKFKNAFSGIWWSVSTLLTVGYGDIYPITTAGKLMAIVISFLGVGMVAIPTGIISAGFVENYTKLTLTSRMEERELKFVTSTMNPNHAWCNSLIRDIVFPPQLLLVMIIREDDVILPKGDTRILSRDTLVIAAKNFKDEEEINLKEVLIKEEHPWIGLQIKELDISRLEMIVMIQRRNKVIIPNGATMIKKDDKVVLYSHLKK